MGLVMGHVFCTKCAIAATQRLATRRGFLGGLGRHVLYKSSLICITIFALQSYLALAAIGAELQTLAGSGAAGFADGSAGEASFLMPEGLALAPNGDVYIADSAAQRIRRVNSKGFVTTVAGSGQLDSSQLWVPGGYSNGKASSARFNQPRAVAFARSGDLIVADSGNHCLRMIREGVVADFSGICGRTGSADGARASALFTNPIALAFDRLGELFVADLGVGIRKISPDGTVATLNTVSGFAKDLQEATGLSIYENSSNVRTLFVATRAGMFLLDPAEPTSIRYYAPGPWESPGEHSEFVAGKRPFGHPYAVAAVANDKFVFTDVTTNSVRFLTSTLSSMAIGMPTENAAFQAGTFRDGNSVVARISQPRDIAQRPNGTFIVSDTGNRRIRALSGIDFRFQTQTSDLANDTSSYRIVYVGDSFVNSNQDWSESIAGILERRLRQNWKALGFPRAPAVYPIEVIADLSGTRDFIDNYLSTGLADMVILQLNSGQVALSIHEPLPKSTVPYALKWQPLVTDAVRSIASGLAKSGAPLIVALNPLPYEVSPSESGWMNLFNNATYIGTPGPPGDYQQVRPLFLEAVAAANVPVIDSFGAFHNEELQRVHPALFAVFDPHFTVAGAELNARVILSYLLRTQPWRHGR